MRVDLSSHKFGRLTVLSMFDGGHPARCMVRCDCSVEKVVRAKDLKNGKIQSCGCIRKEKARARMTAIQAEAFIDLTGKIFGKLRVLSVNGNSKRREILWQCQCLCGNERVVSTGRLKSGEVTSCGCGNHQFADISGVRFGRLVAVERIGSLPGKQSLWACFCDCGNAVRVRVASLANADTKSCGCLHDERSAENARRMSYDRAEYFANMKWLRDEIAREEASNVFMGRRG